MPGRAEVLTGLTLEEVVVMEIAQTRWEGSEQVGGGGSAAGGLEGPRSLHQLLEWLVSGPFMSAYPYPLNRLFDISLQGREGGFLDYGVPSYQSCVEFPQDRSALVS